MYVIQKTTLRNSFQAVGRCAAVLLFAIASGCGGAGPAGAGGVGSGGAPAADPGANPSLPGTAEANSAQTTTGANTDHHRCGWIGADHFEEGTATFVANPDFFQAIHPKWFTLNSDGTPRANQFVDDARIVDTAHAHHVLLMPLIDADSGDILRNMLSSPDRIAAHVQLLTALVMQHGYDGIEIDYEHLWTAADRAPFSAFVTQLGAALHQEGKKLSLAIPAMDHDDGQNAYDYAVLNRAADVLHLMGYDFHYLGGDHLGPLAPIGWIDATAARAASIGDPSKYVLGVANYGIGSGWYTLSAGDAAARCTGPIETTTDHMLTCPYGPRAAGRSPHCQTAQGAEWFEDAGSVAEKAQVAVAHGLGGMTYWTVGGEPAGFREAIKAAFP